MSRFMRWLRGVFKRPPSNDYIAFGFIQTEIRRICDDACQELGRRFIGWEDTRETYDKATHRIKEAGKQQPLFAPKAAQATQLQLG